MALPSKLYLTTNKSPVADVLDNVTAWAWGHRYVYLDTYRDEWDVAGTMNPAPAGGTGFASMTGVGVVGVSGKTPADKAFTDVIYSAPDGQTHTPPRLHRKLLTGYFFAFDNASIPEPAEPASASVVFTAATTDICTAAAHPFDNGDKVTVHTTTALPAGLVSTAVYDLVKIDANTFKLALFGAVVDITSTGTGTHTVVLVSPVALPANVPGGILFVPDAWEPRISTSNPG